MAMITCLECGKEVSGKASACIHCGYPFEREPEKENAVVQPVTEPLLETQTVVEPTEAKPFQKNKMGCFPKILIAIGAVFSAFIVLVIIAAIVSPSDTIDRPQSTTRPTSTSRPDRTPRPTATPKPTPEPSPTPTPALTPKPGEVRDVDYVIFWEQFTDADVGTWIRYAGVVSNVLGSVNVNEGLTGLTGFFKRNPLTQHNLRK